MWPRATRSTASRSPAGPTPGRPVRAGRRRATTPGPRVPTRSSIPASVRVAAPTGRWAHRRSRIPGRRARRHRCGRREGWRGDRRGDGRRRRGERGRRDREWGDGLRNEPRWRRRGRRPGRRRPPRKRPRRRHRPRGGSRRDRRRHAAARRRCRRRDGSIRCGTQPVATPRDPPRPERDRRLAHRAADPAAHRASRPDLAHPSDPEKAAEARQHEHRDQPVLGSQIPPDPKCRGPDPGRADRQPARGIGPRPVRDPGAQRRPARRPSRATRERLRSDTPYGHR